jgi:hypothetical protein
LSLCRVVVVALRSVVLGTAHFGVAFAIGLHTVWSNFLSLCEQNKYHEAVHTHFTEAMKEHLPEEKAFSFFNEFFKSLSTNFLLSLFSQLS